MPCQQRALKLHPATFCTGKTDPVDELHEPANSNLWLLAMAETWIRQVNSTDRRLHQTAASIHVPAVAAAEIRSF